MPTRDQAENVGVRGGEDEGSHWERGLLGMCVHN